MAVDAVQTLVALLAGLLGGMLGALFLLRRGQPRMMRGGPSSTAPALLSEMPAVLEHSNQGLALAKDNRHSLPQRIILVRHGESEGNADHTLYRTKPDNLINLTARGEQQAREVGARIRAMVGPSARVTIIASPFDRTLQTMRSLRGAFGAGQVVETAIEPRVREQEFGNLQGESFKEFRLEQMRVGRFYYRFPTGESGSDVYGRTKEWWDSSVLNINLRPGMEKVDTVVVVTHGLTMRLILMQLFGWSPNTFHTIWNADNCACYVLRKDETLPGRSPYALCRESGDTPHFSRELLVRVSDALDDDVVDLSPCIGP